MKQNDTVRPLFGKLKIIIKALQSKKHDIGPRLHQCSNLWCLWAFSRRGQLLFSCLSMCSYTMWPILYCVRACVCDCYQVLTFPTEQKEQAHPFLPARAHAHTYYSSSYNRNRKSSYCKQTQRGNCGGCFPSAVCVCVYIYVRKCVPITNALPVHTRMNTRAHARVLHFFLLEALFKKKKKKE